MEGKGIDNRRISTLAFKNNNNKSKTKNKNGFYLEYLVK